MKTVFLLCDTLRYDRVTPNIMPNVSRLAQEGVNYTMFFGDGGTTKSSMPFFLCGQKQFELENSFPQILTKNNIKTSIVHSNAVLVRENYQDCFEKHVDMGMEKDPIKTGIQRHLKDAGLWNKTRSLRRIIKGKKAFNLPYRRAENVLGEAQSTLDKRGDGFLWVQLMDPHIPYRSPDLTNFEQLESQKLNDKVMKSLHGESTILPKESMRLSEFYDRECAYMDKCVGDFVKNNPDCLFMVSSDHGDMFGENFTYSHSPGKHGVTPQLGHLPLIIYGPDVPSETYAHYNSSINIGVTILELYGITERCGYGRSFLADFRKS